MWAPHGLLCCCSSSSTQNAKHDAYQVIPSWPKHAKAIEPHISPPISFLQIHKIIAGLVDAYELCAQQVALEMAKRMVEYHWTRTQAVIAAKGRDHWNGVLNCEFGGMNEVQAAGTGRDGLGCGDLT